MENERELNHTEKKVQGIFTNTGRGLTDVPLRHSLNTKSAIVLLSCKTREN